MRGAHTPSTDPDAPRLPCASRTRRARAGADHERARALAESARDEYRRAPKAEKSVAEIDAWLAAHRKG
jgi:hypothetical protein